MSDFLTYISTQLVANFHFLRPFWLLALLPSFYMFVVLIRKQSRASDWQQLVAPHLLTALVDGSALKRSRVPLWFLLICWCVITIALAGPTWQKRAMPVHKETSALVIVWDMSPSMLAEDIKPSRLVRSRLKLIDLLNERRQGLTALIAYSGDAHVVTPLTDDTDTIINLLGGLEPGMMPSAGSNTEQALETAQQLLKDGGVVSGDIVILTDGIANDARPRLEQLQYGSPHRLTIWGIGTTEGAPIPAANGGFIYDSNRIMVIARLDSKQLSDIAVDLGGLYVPFANSSLDIDTIKSFAFNSGQDQIEATERLFDAWYETGPWLVLFILPIVALAFRRGLVLALPLLFFVLQTPTVDAQSQANQIASSAAPSSAHSSVWTNLWETADQQGYQALQNGDAEAAANTFKDEQWRAIANYKNNNYQAAIEGFGGDSASEHYNRGNALTRSGDYDGAIEAYKKALGKNSALSQAENNLKIAEALKELQQQQSSESEDNQNSDDSKKNESGQNGQEGQDGQQSDQDQQSKSDSQDSDNQSQQGDDQQQQSSSDSNSDENEQRNDGQSDSEQSNTDKNSGTEQTQASKQEQQALEDTYGNNDDKQEFGQKPDEADEEQQQSDTKQQLAEDPLEPADESAEENSKQHARVVSEMTPEQQEAEQALDQWLRKVPDDPSGLLRNKFNYQYRERQRSALQQNNMRTPDGKSQEQRW